MTFRVALHYVCPGNYHVFMSFDVVELLTRDLSRFVEIVLFLLRAYSLGIESTNAVKFIVHLKQNFGSS